MRVRLQVTRPQCDAGQAGRGSSRSCRAADSRPAVGSPAAPRRARDSGVLSELCARASDAERGVGASRRSFRPLVAQRRVLVPGFFVVCLRGVNLRHRSLVRSPAQRLPAQPTQLGRGFCDSR